MNTVPATRVGDLIFVSGQASVDGNGRIVPDSFEGEMRRSIDNLRKVLESCGSDLDHVVQTRNYVRDAGDNAEYNRIYAELFKAPLPLPHHDNELPLAGAALRDRGHRGGQGGSVRGKPLRRGPRRPADEPVAIPQDR